MELQEIVPLAFRAQNEVPNLFYAYSIVVSVTKSLESRYKHGMKEGDISPMVLLFKKRLHPESESIFVNLQLQHGTKAQASVSPRGQIALTSHQVPLFPAWGFYFCFWVGK